MSGPMHEAFLEVHDVDAQPNLEILISPPEPINEVPPEYKPEGLNVVWIPGYWGWDPEKNDFVWVSGLWRDVPPGRKWIPGYWQKTDRGFRWVSGFWQDETAQSLEYLPEPPQSIDSGPSTPAPADNYFYVPGNWKYDGSDYAWCPGYWQTYVDGWVWVPARYVWTPYGNVYRAGYWDRVWDRRGVCFAPIYYSSPIYRTVGYRYSPRHAIRLGVHLLPHLFVNFRYGHFYYGDWYGDQFRQGGFYPWVNIHQHRRRYHDPHLVYYSAPSRRYRNQNSYSWAVDHHRIVARDPSLRPYRDFSGKNAPVKIQRINGRVERIATGVSIGVRYSDFVDSGKQVAVKVRGGGS